PGVLGITGLPKVRRVCEESGRTRLLLLVAPQQYGILGEDLAGLAPTVGLLAEDVTPDRVVQAVRRLSAGEPVGDAELVVAGLKPNSPLTAREIAVLRLAAEGLSIKEIAMKLSLSPGTVRNHLSRILSKVGARTRIEAIAIAREAGWI